MIDSKMSAGMSDFRRQLHADFGGYLLRESNRYKPDECLRVDLHCHDHNSDIPDELWGRILRLPETWLKTKHLIECLKSNGCDAFTITNHNNARSCWALMDKGHDVISGAEFTCLFEEYRLYMHVLAYGFTPEQESILNQKRRNIFDFLRYTTEQNIPVILPHPLYFYTPSPEIDLALFEKLAVMFSRFEVLNGQRDVWQSMLTLRWARGLTEEKVHSYAKKHNLNPADFGVDPARAKILTGGSDDHMGIFAGQSGSQLWIPNLEERLKTSSRSELALEALRQGHVVPYGHVAENQKLSIALLDYFSQCATNIKDPGLLRILLHRGETHDKLACLAIGNFLMEIQNHKYSSKYFQFIHNALQGRKPGKLVKWKVAKDYRFCVDILKRVANARKLPPNRYVDEVSDAIYDLNSQLAELVVRRVGDSPVMKDRRHVDSVSTELLTRKFEIPSQLSSLFLGNSKRSDMSNINFMDLLENLTFPIMISALLIGANLASTRLLYKNRNFLNRFAASTGGDEHPRRALYLTDTLRDKNGVSNSLRGKLREIQRQDLPIDFLICDEDVHAEPNLHVVRPLTTFSVSAYSHQEFRIPNLLDVARVFYEGGYDRVVCSTEGPMALVSLFLKYMFNVPAFFFMHTDWMDFIRHTTNLNAHERDRVRRVLRALYRQYEGVFVLNTDHKDWLTGDQINLSENQVHLTAHHAQPKMSGVTACHKSQFFADATDDTPVLFVACRLSPEKGIFDLPAIMERVKKSIPDVRIVIAGTGPAEDELKAALPEARFLGWVGPEVLSSCYQGLDLFVLPSRFDTFGNVILEAFVNGMPAVAFNCKGPKNIIENESNGFLVDSVNQFADRIAGFLNLTDDQRSRMRREAERRAGEYQAEPIMRRFLADLGLPNDSTAVTDTQRSVA